MDIHHSGIYAAELEVAGMLYTRMDKVERQHRNSVQNHHETFHFVDTNRRTFRHLREDEATPIFDFGTREIDAGSPADFARFVENDPDIVHFPICVHTPGNPALNWRLLRDMEAAGARPAPIICYGDGPDVVNYYLHNYSRIAIGGFAGHAAKDVKAWLDRTFSLICGPDGRPTRTIHGCGVTLEMLRYPWSSIHCNWWRTIAAAGSVFLPDSGKVVDVSNVSNRLKVPGGHLQTLTAIERGAILAQFAAKDFDAERIGRLVVSRYAWNLYAITKYFRENPPAKRFAGMQVELF